jgi:hypothetical protein
MEIYKFLESVKSKESFFLFIYYVVIIFVSIYLVFDYWNPIPMQSTEYGNFQNITTIPINDATGNRNSTIEEIIKTNDTMRVTIKKTVNFDPQTKTNTVIQNETVDVLNDNHRNLNFNNSKIHREFQLILLSLFFGLIGSTMHGLASLVTYVASKRYRNEWFLWYLGRPIIGGVIALMFYVIIRGGILSINAQPTDLNYFGIAAISVIAGLVATEGTKKIRDIFVTLFGATEKREKGEEELEDAKAKIESAHADIEKAQENIQQKGEQGEKT